jgi:hypothetical protein
VSAQQALTATFITVIGSALLSWAWFSLYHGMQKITAGWFSDRMHRSFLWMVVFFIGLPFFFAPIVGALYFIGFDLLRGAPTSIFAIALIFLGSASLFLGWLISYLPQRETLKRIGAWGWPDNDGGAEQ